MFLITFYSFKGGVGRTTALVHVAWLLKEAGKKVLVWDMDLDAPGFVHQPFMRSVRANRGFIDFLVDYLRTAEIPRVQDYIAPSDVGFDVLPAGRPGDPEYPRKLGLIDWNKLNEDYYGQVLVERLRTQLQEAGYDYVLVDSKTGFGDVGGFCTLQLPDAVALIFGLNDQNLAGIKGVYELLARHNEEKPTRRIEVVPVVSPYWPMSSDALAGRMSEAKRIFSNEELLTISFDTALAFRETIIFQQLWAIECRAATDYRRLCSQLRKLNLGDQARLDEEMAKVLAFWREQCALCAKAVEVKPDNHEAWNTWGVALHKLADATGDATLRREACEKYAKAVEAKPDMHEAWYNWGLALGKIADATGDVTLLREACEKFAKAVEAKPDMHEAWYNWGVALGKIADATRDVTLRREACEKYAKAVEAKPDKHEALFNWGVELDTLADATGDVTLRREACEKYAKATQAKPDKHQAWCNWGVTLDKLADATGDVTLRREACEKFAKAVEAKPDMHEAWDNWGTALLKLYAAEPVEALLVEAREKCSRTEELKPGSGAYNLACVESRTGNLEACFAWLTRAMVHKPSIADHALTDPDLEVARRDDRFWQIVGRPKPTQGS